MKIPELLIINLLFVLCRQVQQVIGIQREFREIILDPINLSATDNKIVQNAELPIVTDEVSVTLRLLILSHNPGWACVFHKGGEYLVRTPAVWLTPTFSAPFPRFSTNDDPNVGIDSVGKGLSLNQWYHLAYTLSEPEKRLDFYINGQLVSFTSVLDIRTGHIIFNDEPLYIGNDIFFDGIIGQISKFRYYNWRLSADEVAADFQDNNTSTSPKTSPITSPTMSLTTSSQITPASTTQEQTTHNPPTLIQPEKSNNIATMAGISIGVSIGSIILTITCFLLYKSYKKNQNYERNPPADGVRVAD